MKSSLKSNQERKAANSDAVMRQGLFREHEGLKVAFSIITLPAESSKKPDGSRAPASHISNPFLIPAGEDGAGGGVEKMAAAALRRMPIFVKSFSSSAAAVETQLSLSPFWLPQPVSQSVSQSEISMSKRIAERERGRNSPPVSFQSAKERDGLDVGGRS